MSTPSGPRVGLAEIAAAAAVSEATVSRVLNRRYGVATSTREAVERAMHETGFERSVSGQVVALIATDLTNPFFARLGQGISAELVPHGLRSIVCQVNAGNAEQRDYIAMLIDIGVAAVVFMSASNTTTSADRSVAELLRSRGVPFVTINGPFDGFETPTFSTNEHVAASLAVEHLVALGHSRIGLAAGPPGNIPSDRRVEGFIRSMANAGLSGAADRVVRQSYTIDGGRHAAEMLLRRSCTAIVAASDHMALGGYKAVQRAGLSVPDDVSIIGYDDDVLLDFTSPALTTVRTPVSRLATQAGRSLLAMLSGQRVDMSEMFFDPELHVRHSTKAPPTR